MVYSGILKYQNSAFNYMKTSRHFITKSITKIKQESNLQELKNNLTFYKIKL